MNDDDVMVTGTDWRIAANFAKASSRGAFVALGALDWALGSVVATTTEPLIGQMRLTWWHERLTALDHCERAAEPILEGLQTVLHHDVTGAELGAMIDGWQALLEAPLDATALEIFAEQRGERLFEIAARLTGGEACGGAGWALADFARRCSDTELASLATTMARKRLKMCSCAHARPLRILTRLAKGDARRPIAQTGRPRPRRALLRALL